MRAPYWSRGQRIFADKLNDMSRAINQGAQAPSSIVDAGGQTYLMTEWFEVVSLDDVNRRLSCKLYGEPAGSPFLFEVELPPIFTEASRGSITYTYSSLNDRTANDGGDTETQQITPEFIVGDFIRAELFRDSEYWRFIGDGRMWAQVLP